MAGKTLQQILGYVSLTGVIQGVKTGIPDNLPPAFMRTKRSVLADQGRYTRVTGTRQTARQNQYGSPARNRALRDISNVDVKLISSYESVSMDPQLLQTLRNYDNYDIQSMGIQEVDRQTAQFRQLFDNLDLSCIYSMLANGKIWFDGEGNLLPTSSGAVVTVNFQMNANNQNQLNGIVTASWANANTDIPLQLRNLKVRAAELTGYPLKYAFYGVNIPSYLTSNNYVQEYLSRNVSFAQKWLEAADVPDGLFGLTWVPVYTSFYEDQNGTNQTFFGGDTVVFTPEINADVYELLEGTTTIPTTFNATADLASSLDTLKQVTGMYSYGMVNFNPVGITMYGGNVSLPVMKVPDAYYQCDTTP